MRGAKKCIHDRNSSSEESRSPLSSSTTTANLVRPKPILPLSTSPSHSPSESGKLHAFSPGGNSSSGQGSPSVSVAGSMGLGSPQVTPSPISSPQGHTPPVSASATAAHQLFQPFLPTAAAFAARAAAAAAADPTSHLGPNNRHVFVHFLFQPKLLGYIKFSFESTRLYLNSSTSTKGPSDLTSLKQNGTKGIRPFSGLISCSFIFHDLSCGVEYEIYWRVISYNQQKNFAIRRPIFKLEYVHDH